MLISSLSAVKSAAGSFRRSAGICAAAAANFDLAGVAVIIIVILAISYGTFDIGQ